MSKQRDIKEMERELRRSEGEDIRNNQKRPTDDPSRWPQSERTKELQRQIDEAKRDR